MLERLPDQFEPMGLAEAGRDFRGVVSIEALPRLADYLAESTGQLAVELSFKVDERLVRALTGKLEGQLDLICQRCLDKMAFPLNLQFQLGIVNSEAEADELPDDYEILLVDGDPIALSQIIEDEIILALPIISKHDDAALCNGSKLTHKPESQKESPFAVLKQLNTK
jgi:uncharacterized protein